MIATSTERSGRRRIPSMQSPTATSLSRSGGMRPCPASGGRSRGDGLFAMVSPAPPRGLRLELARQPGDGAGHRAHPEAATGLVERLGEDARGLVHLSDEPLA